MSNQKNFTSIEPSQLLDRAKSFKEKGYRFCQACADSAEDGFEFVYSFANEEEVINLKFTAGIEESLDSITFVYWNAFFDELDMVKNFRINFKHAAADHAEDYRRVQSLTGKMTERLDDIRYMTEHRTCKQMVYAAERVPGSCGFGNSLGYCMAVEKAMGIRIPERGERLRVMFHELSRAQSHLLNLSSLAKYIGSDALSSICLKIREGILDIFDKMTGSRIMLSVCCIGGIKKDISDEIIAEARDALTYLRQDMEKLSGMFFGDVSVRERLAGIGILDVKDAAEFCVGPAARAAGIARDARGSSFYNSIGFEPVTEEGGDCYARCRVKAKEVLQSIDIAKRAVEDIPGGNVNFEINAFRAGEAVVSVEQPEGQALYYVKTSDSEFLKLMNVKLPEICNMPALVRAAENCDFVDVPVLALSMDSWAGDLKW